MRFTGSLIIEADFGIFNNTECAASKTNNVRNQVFQLSWLRNFFFQKPLYQCGFYRKKHILLLVCTNIVACRRNRNSTKNFNRPSTTTKSIARGQVLHWSPDPLLRVHRNSANCGKILQLGKASFSALLADSSWPSLNHDIIQAETPSLLCPRPPKVICFRRTRGTDLLQNFLRSFSVFC